jgi:hypothetical protein
MLQTTACAPEHCGDGVIIEVRVKIDPAGTVTAEPGVVWGTQTVRKHTRARALILEARALVRQLSYRTVRAEHVRT